MRYILIVLLLLLNTSYANSEPIKFKHPDNLFEFFILIIGVFLVIINQSPYSKETHLMSLLHLV